MIPFITVSFALALVPAIQAHMAPYHSSMWCLNGTSGQDNQNTNDAVNPLYMLPKSQWWMHANNNCDKFPPAPGKFLELPAGKSFTVEIATNRAFTSYSYDGRFVGTFGDGQAHPELEDLAHSTCVTSPNLHTENATRATGTAFAISYNSNIEDVTMENLVTFTVRYHTPWKLLTTYDVPAGMPPCPAGGCICVWGWVASHCGQPNMYFLPYRCKVTGNTGTRRIAQPKPATYCEGDQTKCVRGAKQPIIWNQAEGSNLITTPGQLPGYNMKLGFADGAQNDIFEPEPTPSQSTAAPSNTTVADPPTRSALECLGMKAVKVLDKRRLHRRWIKL
ncbi:hypothetical protein FRB91_000401 [Serendipita sp. 411]|nr:hypothetical protein FRB91_000401 [Serendipita sp. 411]